MTNERAAVVVFVTFSLVMFLGAVAVVVGSPCLPPKAISGSACVEMDSPHAGPDTLLLSCRRTKGTNP